MDEPVAWINKTGNHGYLEWDKDDEAEINTPLYTQDQLEEARKLGMQQERALWNLSASTQEIMNTHPVKELTDRISELENQLGFIASINRAGLGVVTATPMSSEKIEKIWNAIEEQKDDNFHYGWKKCEQYYGFAHPVKEQDESFDRTASHMAGEYVSYKAELTDEEIEECFAESCTDFKLLENGKTKGVVNIIDVGRAILKKAQEADKIESLGTINIGGVHFKNGKEVK